MHGRGLPDSASGRLQGEAVRLCRAKPLPVLWCLERLLEPVPNAAGDTALHAGLGGSTVPWRGGCVGPAGP